MPPSDAKSGIVFELAEEFLERYRQGERPALKEYIDRHPDLAGEIREVFPAMAMMENIALIDSSEASPAASAPGVSIKQLGDYRIVREVGRGGMGIVYEAEQVSLGRHVALKLLPDKALSDPRQRLRFEREARAAAKLHHTNIVPVFGVGEHDGTPYYVMQFIQGLGLDKVLEELCRLQKAGEEPSLSIQETRSREVAPPHSQAAVDMARSLLTGRFNLTDAFKPPDAAPSNPVETPVSSGTHSLSSSSINLPGQSRDGVRGQSRRLTYWQSVAQIGIQVADALEYAHKQGIIHRDIKPSNLLLDARGTVWVTDFGLAKLNDEQNLTQTGDLLGTFRYMPPEAFEGKADARGDVYSLGITLYEMLAMQPAFDERDRVKLVKQVTTGEPLRLNKVNRTIPRDLVTIVHKAIERDLVHRYQVPGELVADLQRFLNDEPIHARRVSLRERAWRWCRRNPMVASLVGLVFLLLNGIAIALLIGNARLAWTLTDAEEKLAAAVRSERKNTRLREAEALVAEATSIRYSRREGQRFAALAALKKAADIGREAEQPKEWFDRLRNGAIAALALPDMHVTRQWAGWPEGTVTASVSEDGRLYRSDKMGGISIRRLEDDREIAQIPAVGGPGGVYLSTDGNDLAQVWINERNERVCRVWHLISTGPVERFRVPNVESMIFMDRPEGRLAVFCSPQGGLSVYQVTTGQRQALFDPIEVTMGGRLAAHPQEPVVAISSYHHRGILIRDVRTGAVVCRETPPWTLGSNCFWHPSGRYLCICQNDGPAVIRVYHFDAPTQRLTYWRTISCGHQAPVLVFNQAGDRFVAWSIWHNGISMWDFWTGRKLFEPTTSPHTLAFGLDASQLALATIPERPDHVGIWSVADAREYRAIISPSDDHKRSPYAFAVHPNGRMAAQGDSNGICLFDLVTGAEMAFLQTPAGGTGEYPAFDRDGSLYTNSFAGAFRWPVRTDPADARRFIVGPPQALPFHLGNRAIATSADGRVVSQAMWFGYGMDQYAGCWILHPNHPKPRRVAAGASIARTSVSPDGRWVACTGAMGAVVYEAATAKEVCRMLDDGSRFRFSSDSRSLLAGSTRSHVYATGTWTKQTDLGPGSVLDCTSDGTVAVLLLPGGTYRLVEIASGRELAQLEDPQAHSGDAQFTPDGTKLVIQAPDGMRVWDLRRLRRELEKLGLDWEATPYPPADPTESDPGAPPLEVKFVGTDLLNPKPATPTSALDDLRVFLFVNPKTSADHVARGRALSRLGWHNLALLDCGLAIRADPRSHAARSARAHEYVRRNDWTRAEADLTVSLNIAPDCYPCRLRRGWANFELGKFAEAAADLDLCTKAVSAEYKPGIMLLRAAAIEKCGKLTEADAARQEAAKLTPNLANAANSFAWWYLTHGPADAYIPSLSLLLARKAVELAPTEATYHNTLGFALYRTGKYPDARDALENSLNIGAGKHDAWDLYILAMCHHRLGDAEKARDCYNRAAAWQESATLLTTAQIGELNAIRDEARRVIGR